MSHGPRVEPGTRWFVNSAVMHANDLQDENVTLLPSMYVGGSHGWVRSDGGPAFTVGFQLPVFLMPAAVEGASARWLWGTSYLDLYAQPRRAATGGLDYGAGTLLSADVAMPYVQLGRAGDGGFYTTQAVAFTHGTFSSARYWMPEIAFRSERRDGTRGVDFYLSAAVGGPTSRSETEWLFSAGVVADFMRGR